MRARLPEAEKRGQQVVDRAQAQRSQRAISVFLALGEALIELGRALAVGSPIKVLFHRREMQPVDVFGLRRQLDLVLHIRLGGAPHDGRKERVHGLPFTLSIRSQDFGIPSFGVAKGLHTQEHDQSVEILQGFLDRRSGHGPPEVGHQLGSHLSRFGRGAFHHLRLVQTESPPVDAEQGARRRVKALREAPAPTARLFAVYQFAPDHFVRRHDHVVVAEPVRLQIAMLPDALINENSETRFGDVLLHFVHPLLHNRRW